MDLDDVIDGKDIRDCREDVGRSGVDVEVVESRVPAGIIVCIGYEHTISMVDFAELRSPAPTRCRKIGCAQGNAQVGHTGRIGAVGG